MTTKKTDADTPAEAPTLAPIVSANPDAEDAREIKTTKRSDAAQAFVQRILSAHPVPQSAFGPAEAVALIEAIDAAG